MATITTTGQILSHTKLPSPRSSSSTSIRRNQISVGNPKNMSFSKAMAIVSVFGLVHNKYKRRRSILSLEKTLIAVVVLALQINVGRTSILSTGRDGGGNGGSGPNGGFGDGGGGDGGGRFPMELISYSTNSGENNQSDEVTEVELQNNHSDLEKYILSGILSGISIRAGSKTMFKKQLESELKSLFSLEIYQKMLIEEKSNLEVINSSHWNDFVIRSPFLKKLLQNKVQLQKLLQNRGDLEARTNPSGGVTYIQQSDDVKTECSIVTGRGGPLNLASLEPGGIMSFEHRNILGNASIISSVALSRLLHPQNDINYNIKYVQPCFGGNTFCLSAYKTLKLSPALPMGVDQVHHPTWFDKVGIKANITENFTPETNFTYGMVLEETTPHNCSNGLSLSDGTPTPPSGGDLRLYGQATLTRDNTKFVNGAIVGDKIKFQIDQGPGLCERFPLFNRHQLTMTRFHQLKEAEGVGKPSPPVLVLHVHYGGYAGDLLPHDTFTLGGPESVRGYNVGAIGAARNILEVAAEVRVPVRKTQVFAFAEHGNDLGSSRGNPTEGHGSSYGVGAKLGFVRVEYAINHNSHTGEFSVRFGERF